MMRVLILWYVTCYLVVYLFVELFILFRFVCRHFYLPKYCIPYLILLVDKQEDLYLLEIVTNTTLPFIYVCIYFTCCRIWDGKEEEWE